MIFGFLGALAVVLIVVWRRHHVRVNKPGPLAGYDTGVRSARRTPERFFHNRRTF